MKILITGSAGFIGFHLSLKLLNKGNTVIGVDNLNNYYDVSLKKNRNKILKKYTKYIFYKLDLKNKNQLDKVFKRNKIDCVINLAAQAGVRYSLINPKSYIESNINGFFNLIETTKNYKIKNFIYASTSSVYGVQKKFPLKEYFDTNHPIQLYAATKKSNELIANAYSHLFKLNTIGLRFFTVYGPWGRPDMALFKFTKNIIDGKKIEVFNHGKHIRDFTYVDDVINIIYKIISKNSKIKRSNNSSKIYNVGNGKKIKLKEYIDIIEKNLKKKSKKKFLSLQKGDVIKTHCDNRLLKREYNCAPKINVEQGVKKFLQWYTSYYKKNKKLI